MEAHRDSSSRRDLLGYGARDCRGKTSGRCPIARCMPDPSVPARRTLTQRSGRGAGRRLRRVISVSASDRVFGRRHNNDASAPLHRQRRASKSARAASRAWLFGVTVAAQGTSSTPQICAGLAGVVGLSCVVISTSYAQSFGLRSGPLPFDYPWAAIGTFVATGMLLMLAIMLQPRLFWPLLIVTSTVTGGMFVLGFSIFDEWLAGCIVLGAVPPILRGAVPLRKGGLHSPGVVVFLFFASYMCMQAIVGAIAYGPKALRFVLLYAVVFLMSLLLAMYQFPLPNPRTVSLLVGSSACVYFALYMLHGLFFLDFLSLVVFREMEGIGGAGTAYAAFPIAVAVPAALLMLRNEHGLLRVLAIVTLALAIAVGILAQSRGAVLALGAC